VLSLSHNSSDILFPRDLAAAGGAASVFSGDSAATVVVEAGGSSTSDIVVVGTGTGSSATISLHSGNESTSITHKHGALAVSSNNTDLLTVSLSDGLSNLHGDCLVARYSAAHTAVSSTSSNAVLEVSSAARGASLHALSPAGQKATLALTSGAHSLAFQTLGDYFSVTNGSASMLTLGRTSGDATFIGDLLSSSTGATSLDVRSADSTALLAVSSSGSHAATATMQSGPGLSAELRLSEAGGSMFAISNSAADEFVIRDSEQALLSVSLSSGVAISSDLMTSNVTVASSTNTSQMKVQSVAGVASLEIHANSSAAAGMNVVAQPGHASTLLLSSGNKHILLAQQNNVLNVGTTSVTSAMQLSNSSVGSNVLIPIALEVGASSAAALMTVKSTQSTSILQVEAAGSAAAFIDVKAESSSDAVLEVAGDAAGPYMLLADGVQQKFVVKNGTAEIFSLTQAGVADATNASLRGDLLVPGQFRVNSNSSAATLNVNGNTTAFELKSPSGVDSQIAFSNGNEALRLVNDATEQKLVVTDGTNKLFSVEKTTGNVFIKGALIFGDVFEVSVNGTAKGDTDIHKMVNTINAADMANTRSTARFSHYTYPDMSERTSALITVACATNMTSTASTQDGIMDLFTTQDAVTRRVLRFNSNGNIGIGSGTSVPASKLEVAGNGLIEGETVLGCLNGACNGARTASVHSIGGTAGIAIQASLDAHLNISGGGAHDAVVNIQAASGQQSRLVLSENSTNSFAIQAASTGMKVLNELNQSLLAISSSDDAVSLLGDLTVGNASNTNISLTLAALGPGNAGVNVVSDSSSASITLATANSASPQLTLSQENVTAYMFNLDSSSRFKMSRGPSSGGGAGTDYLTIGNTFGETTLDNMYGGLTFAGGAMDISSTGGAAEINIASTASSSALLMSGNSTASLILGTGEKTFIMRQDASQQFVLFENASLIDELLTVHRQTAAVRVKGSMTVANLSTSSGTKSTHVTSTDNAATVQVSSGAGTDATFSLSSPAGASPTVTLRDMGSHTWRLENDAPSDALKLSFVNDSGFNSTWLSISHNGAATFQESLTTEGDLTVGGTCNDCTGAKTTAVTSTNASSISILAATAATMTVTSRRNDRDALISLTANNSYSSKVSFKAGNNGFDVRADGSSNSFYIGTTGNDAYLELSPGTGSALFKGGLNVKSDSLYVKPASGSDSDGYVGMGTSSPIVALQLKGATGLTVGHSQNDSTTAFQVRSASASVLNGIAMNVDTINNRVGVGTSAPTEALHINGGSLMTSQYMPQRGDLIVLNGTVNLPYMAHDSVNRIGGSNYSCMKIGSPTSPYSPYNLLTKSLGVSCPAACGAGGSEADCDATNCGVGGWCTNKGLHNHYIVVSEHDVYLPRLSSPLSGREYWIIFKRDGNETHCSTPPCVTSRYVVAKGTGTRANPACTDCYMRVNAGAGMIQTEHQVAFPSGKSVTYATCIYDTLWDCYTFN